MMKYVDTKVTFSEVPDEISLCISISNCPHRCKNCHSSYLAEDIGTPLIYEENIEEFKVINFTNLSNLIRSHRGVSCVCFMGGDANIDLLNILGGITKSFNLKSAWYSGDSKIPHNINLDNFDYIKIGPYIEELGPLDSITTNQRLYKVIDGKLLDITNKFWRGKK